MVGENVSGCGHWTVLSLQVFWLVSVGSGSSPCWVSSTASHRNCPFSICIKPPLSIIAICRNNLSQNHSSRASDSCSCGSLRLQPSGLWCCCLSLLPWTGISCYEHNA